MMNLRERQELAAEDPGVGLIQHHSSPISLFSSSQGYRPSRECDSRRHSASIDRLSRRTEREKWRTQFEEDAASIEAAQEAAQHALTSWTMHCLTRV